MPLHKPEGYDLTHASYELKVTVVLKNCSGCPYLLNYEDSHQIPVIGCIYPNDIQGKVNGRYITLLEIAHNTCTFWQDKAFVEVETIDSTPDWDDERAK